MAAVLYRKIDGLIVFTISDGMIDRGDEVEFDRNVIPSYGGKASDYARLSLTPAEFASFMELSPRDSRVMNGSIIGSPAVIPEELPSAPRNQSVIDMVAAVDTSQIEDVAARTAVEELKAAILTGLG